MCDEVGLGSDWFDFSLLKNNGCTAKISKTDSRGFTSFTFTYFDANHKKQTIKYKWQDQEGTDEFTYNGHVCSFWWDCLPFGIFLTVDGVEHGYVLKPKSSANPSIPIEWQKARTLKGAFGEGCGEDSSGAEGTALLKCGKANKRGIAKVSLTITPFSGKKQTYKAVSVDVSQGGRVDVQWPETARLRGYNVSIDGDEFFGEPIYGDERPCCSPNAVWSADIGGPVAGNHYLSFWSWYDTYYYYDDDYLYSGSEYAFLDAIGLLSKYEGGVCVSSSVSENMTDGLMFATSGNKWQFESDSLDERPRVRLSYSPATGLFKGTITIRVGPYCMRTESGGPRFQNKNLKVTGAYIDGRFFGAATIKGFSTPIYGE